MRIERPLTKEELEIIKAAPTWDMIIVEIFKAMIPDFDNLEEIDPTSVAIPQEQWGHLCKVSCRKAKDQYNAQKGWNNDRRGTDELGVHIALEFMNKGPSSY